MANREIEQIVKKLQGQGWRIVEGKHYKCFPPDKAMPMVVIPKTPSDHRSIRNAIAQLRRSGADL